MPPQSTDTVTVRYVDKNEGEKEKLIAKYKQRRKKEKECSDIEKVCNEKIANAEESIKKKQRDDKSYGILHKSLGCFLGGGMMITFKTSEG